MASIGIGMASGYAALTRPMATCAAVAAELPGALAYVDLPCLQRLADIHFSLNGFG